MSKIFIFGFPRSGTTMLNKVLNAHPDIYFPLDELNELGYFYKNRHLYNKYGNKKYFVMTKDIYKDSWENPPKNMSAENFKEFVDFSINYHLKEQKKKIFGIKIVKYFEENIDMIKKLFPDAYCIHIIRDPRDIFLSSRKMPAGINSSYYVGKNWAESICIVRKLSRLDHYYELKYEEFISNPEKQVRKLCDFLEIKFSKKMLNFNRNINIDYPRHKLLKKGFVKDNFDKWKMELSREDLKSLYCSAQNKMFELGYINKKYKLKKSSLSKITEKICYRTSLLFRVEENIVLAKLPFLKIRLTRMFGLK